MRNTLLSLAVALLMSAPALAQTSDGSSGTPAPPSAGGTQASQDAATLGFFRHTELGGLLDVYYAYFSTKTDPLFRNFDTKHNAFSLSMAQLWLAKAPTADSRAGFKVKLNFGPASSNFIHAAEPGGAAFHNVQEAYVSYLAKAGKGLQIDVGKFVTAAGAEVIETKDIWNYSHSLLFALAIPYYHAGIRANYSPSDKVTFMVGLVNGWNNVVDNNTGKTVAAGITLKPTSAVSIVENYYGGPERAGSNADWRHLSDTVISYTASPKLTLMANYDYGRESIGAASVHWQGVAAYAKYQVNQWVALIPRLEYYDDSSGFTTGTDQKLKEFTGTIEVKPADNFIWRIEYRGDYSDKSVFTSDTGSLKKNQHSIGFGLLYSFSTRTP